MRASPLPARPGRGDKAVNMKVISSFVLLLTAVTVFASDSPPVETHQVLYIAEAGVVVLRLSVVVEGEGPKQC